MVLIIRQLWNGRLQRPVRVDDVDARTLKYVEKLRYVDESGDTHTYRLYETKPGTIPYPDDYTHYRNRAKNQDERDHPLRIYKRVRTPDGVTREPDLEHLTHEFYTRWGGGCYRGYFFGGQPPFEEFFPTRWIEKQGRGVA